MGRWILLLATVCIAATAFGEGTEEPVKQKLKTGDIEQFIKAWPKMHADLEKLGM